MAARKRKVVLNEEWRAKIGAGNIMARLLKHLNGDVDLSATQVQAARILLAKTVPDLQSVEVGNKDNKPFEVRLTPSDTTLI
jgi:hypothetical protein